MVQLLNSIYLGAAKPDDYGKAAGVVELLPFDYYLGAAVPSSGGIPTINVLLSGVSPLTLLNTLSLNYIKAFGKCEQRNLPVEYVQVNGVTNDGDNYIDLNTALTQDDEIELVFSYSNTTNSRQIFGFRDSASSNNITVFFAAADNRLVIDFNNSNYTNYRLTADLSINTIYTVKLSKTRRAVYQGSTLIAENTTVCNDTISIANTYLYNVAGSPAYVSKFNGTIYSLKINGKRIMTSCTQSTDVGFYDEVSNSMFTLTNGTAGANATPTPDSPIDIVCNNGVIKVKDEELPVGYMRLLDIIGDGDFYYNTGEKLYGSDIAKMTITATSSGNNIFGAYTSAASTARNFSLYGANSNTGVYLRYGNVLNRTAVLGSGKRTITFGAGGTTGFATNATWAEMEFETGSYARIFALPNSTAAGFSGTFHGNIEISDRLKYIPCKRISDGTIGYYEVNTNTFLEPQDNGTPTTSGYDFSHMTTYIDGTVETVEVRRKNLFDITTSRRYRTSWASAGTMQAESASSAAQTYGFATTPGQTYTLSKTGGNRLMIGGFTSVKIPTENLTVQFPIQLSTSDRQSYSFTAPSGCVWILFSVKNNSGNIDDATNIQLELGPTATGYEPYFNGGSATAEPLLSVGNYKDSQNITTGAVTRNVGIKVLDGTENWALDTAGADYQKIRTADIISPEKGPTGIGFCTHFKYEYVNVVGNFYFSSGTGILQMVMPAQTTVAEWQQYLTDQYAAGTPVIIVYPLETPTTETVTGQILTIAKGTNIVEAKGSVDDLELEVSYKAAVEVTVEEIEAVQLDENVEVTIS